MTSRDFAFWLQGYLEVADPENIGPKELAQIKKHLNLVFKHEIDPSMGSKEEQEKLDAVHHPKPAKPLLKKEHMVDPDMMIRC